MGQQEGEPGTCDRVLEHYEDVDVVVNNAGVCLTGTFAATAVEDFRSQMDVVSTRQQDACLRDQATDARTHLASLDWLASYGLMGAQLPFM